MTTCSDFDRAAGGAALALHIRILTDGGPGMTAQACGLAQGIAAQNGEDGVVVGATVRPPAVLRLLPPALAARLLPSPSAGKTPPALVVGCGGGAQAAVLAMKRRYGAFAVCVQRPSANAGAFDAIVAPAHDYSDEEISAIEKTTDGNIILTTGAVGMHAPTRLAEARERARRRFAAYRPPYVAVLLGGDNRAYRMDAPPLVAQLSEVAAKSGATLLLTLSRRSKDALAPALTAAFGDSHYLWDGCGDNPYADMLAAADGFCVSCDSVNMASEACAAGRAAYLLPLPQKSGLRARAAAKKFARFHAALAARHLVRWWEGEWSWFTASPLAETERAAAAVWSLFLHRRKT